MTAERRTRLRTCVACRTGRDQRDFVRIARTKDGVVHVDPGGRGPGRGAYLCPRIDCFDRATERDGLGRGLRARLTEEDIERLRTDFEEALATRADPDRG